MSGNRKRVRLPEGNIVRGLFRLARGDGGGIREFGNTTEAFSASIAPLLAFPLVSAVLFGLTGHWLLAVVMLLSRVCGVLLQPVMTELVARYRASRATWLVTSTALNWSIWLLIPLTLIGGIVSTGLVSLGIDGRYAVIGSLCGSFLYLLWVQCLIMRAGLRLTWLFAVPIVIGMNILIATVCLEPFLVHPSLMALIVHPAVN
ncbi:hypothetical protein AruPA_14790 [Acidiphilium sp. PA]|uniref:hypothetical protein n=1 Tax=Acidiphilium sp. PA TaxID=2871705 RepID=UPI002242C929|nr:hypothetical protein [Acidiphilium sp. PA]MCW8308304.1 hypothetical protein [Acidiphilium sp. PA]